MATRQMIGKIAREDSLAIHSRTSPIALGFMFSLVVLNEELFLRSSVRRCMAETRPCTREPECH